MKGVDALRRNKWAIGLMTACAIGVICLVWPRVHRPRGSIVVVNDVPVRGVLPGEFESHERLILCWDEDVSRLAAQQGTKNQPRTAMSIAIKAAQHAVLTEIVKSTWDKLPVTVFVQHDASQKQAEAALANAGVPEGAVEFEEVPFDTVWVRNFGPTGVRRSAHEQSSKPLWVLTDNQFQHRNQDNQFARILAESFQVPVLEIPLFLSGNVLSNGDGLLVTTEHVAEMNRQRGYSRMQLSRILRECFGASQIVFLEDPQQEPNAHADMICVFTAADTILIGEHTGQYDQVDAAIYDRNAKLLERVRTPTGPLKVVRIPMPARRHRDIWGGAYTNVVFLNKVLLVPTYRGIDEDLQEKAFDVFRQVLPGWKIVGIDCSPMIINGGALRCATMPILRWPNSASHVVFPRD